MMTTIRRNYSSTVETRLDELSDAALIASSEVLEQITNCRIPDTGPFVAALHEYMELLCRTTKQMDDITIIPHTKREAEMAKRELFHGGYTSENINTPRSQCSRILSSNKHVTPALTNLARMCAEKPYELTANDFDVTNADPFSISPLIRTARVLRDCNNISIECLEMQMMAVRGHYWATVLIRNGVPENKALRFVAHEAQFGNEIDADKVLDVWDAAQEVGLPDQLINALYGADVFY